jgi:hypothetical protein
MKMKNKIMDIKKIKKLIASVYWSLKKDADQINIEDIYYDVGYAVSLCLVINKKELGQKIYDRFMYK